PSPAQMRERCVALNDEVWAVLAQGKVKVSDLSLALYHAGGEEDIDVEMAMVVADSGGFTEVGRVKLYTLPAVQTMASAVYHGSYDDFGAVGKVYADINQWISANGYRVTGSSRELYLRAPELCKEDPSGIMEIQFPVEKA
ncbi:MAG: GyrI-like domain-containing protein, partial [Chitinophagaceae bacterium]|nr:GyrI-like domain-containing protein [Anaerolineae bacterium]